MATGHTATDQAETVLMALVRGAGLRGLAGMPPRRPLGGGVDLVRPLLGVARAEVEAYALRRSVRWRDDASNESEGLRPATDCGTGCSPFSGTRAGLASTSASPGAAAHARAGLGVIAHRLGSFDDGRLPLAALDPLDDDARRALLAEAVARWAPGARRSRALVARLSGLVEAPVGTCVDSGGVRVWRERDVLRVDAGGADLGGVLETTPLDAVPRQWSPDPYAEVVDADRAAGAEVRAWCPGDRIRPPRHGRLATGRGPGSGSAACPPPTGAACPSCVRGDEVLWVVGHRLAASVAVRPETTRAARWAWRQADGSG